MGDITTVDFAGQTMAWVHQNWMLGVVLVTKCLLDCSADGITTTPQDSVAEEKLLTAAQNAKNLVVFSGSGLSAGSGGILQVCNRVSSTRWSLISTAQPLTVLAKCRHVNF